MARLWSKNIERLTLCLNWELKNKGGRENGIKRLNLLRLAIQMVTISSANESEFQ